MTKGIDEIPGQHNAKTWFKIMILNGYLQLSLLTLSGLIAFYWYTEGQLFAGDNWMITTIISLALTALVSLGLIRFWNDLKGKR